QDRDVVLLTGRCYERETVPYKALDGVVDELARFLTRHRGHEVAHFLPTRPAPLVQMFPVLRRVEAITQLRTPDEPIADLHELRSRAFGALREMLVRIADRRPLIVVIDDLQWADADSLALLRDLLAPPDEPGLLLIATLRDDAREITGGHLRLGLAESIPGDVRRIQLGRLGKEDARTLASRLVERLSPGLPVQVETLAAEADGHPLFIDEIVRHLFLVGATHGALKLEDALWGRVQSLEEIPRRIVELCAVADWSLPLEAVAKACESPPSDFARYLSFLRVAHLVRTTGTRGNDVIECFHGRVREAIVRNLRADERRAHYLRLAVTLESGATADPNLLAMLWLGAGDNEKAGKQTLAAADRAAAALAFERAARLYERALELLSNTGRNLPRPEERALQAKLGDALSNAGRGAKAAHAYRAAAEGANAADALDLRRRAADQLLRSGHFDEGLSAIQEVLGSIGMKLPPTPGRALLALLFWRLVITLRGLRYRSQDASHVSPRELTRIDVCYAIASSLSLIDPLFGRLFHARNLISTLRAGEPGRIARALAFEVTYTSTAGVAVWNRTRQLDAEARRAADAVGEPFAIAWSKATSGVAHYLGGSFVEALDLCNDAERSLVEQCPGATWETFTTRLFALSSLAQLGRLNELQSRQAAALRWALERGDLYAAVNLRIGYPNLAWLVAGEPARARAEATDAMRQWSQRSFQLEHYYELLALTNADLYDGRGRDAFERLMTRWPLLRRSLLMRVQLIRLFALHMRSRAAVATAAADPSAREDCLGVAERDARAIERQRAEWTVPLTSLVHAGVARLRGDQGRAVEHLRAAQAQAANRQLDLVAASAVYGLGVCLGGDEGGTKKREALQTLEAQGAKEAERLVAVVAPGFVD
ncbi:MAG TPA: AAA family ATPase, partial [Polyangiaceae bacterium]